MPHVCLPEEDVKAPGTGIIDDCEPSCGRWELSTGPF